MMRNKWLPLFLVLALAGCTSSRDDTYEEAASDGDVSVADAFWANLQAHCGQAFSGGLTLEPPGDDMLTGTETLLVHFRECGELEMKVPFHIERVEDEAWDRSRTWIFSRTLDGFELRHDHRRPDGTDDDVTWYGGPSYGEGTANRQEFISEERSAEEGVFLGWRIEIEPGSRYTYGTIRGANWTWRVDFDLDHPVDPPPAPWGHE